MAIQLQNFVSLTTTGTSGASTLTNGVLNVPNYATSGGTWVDYSSTSTIVGWSSFTIKQVLYLISGKQVFIYCVISGTSNSTTVSFTLPNTPISENLVTIIHGVSNGAPIIGRCILTKNSNNITCDYFSNFSVISSFASSGTKSIQTIFNYQIA